MSYNRRVKNNNKLKNNNELKTDNIIMAYYYYEAKKFTEMIEMYNIEIKRGNTLAMCEMARYSMEIKDYTLAKEYCEKAIKGGHQDGALIMGYYYRKYEINHELMIKYFLIGVKMGDRNAMHELGYYYQYTNKDEEQMMKYYMMSIRKNNTHSMCELGCYYENDPEKYGEMMRYFNMAANRNHKRAALKLQEHKARCKSESL